MIPIYLKLSLSYLQRVNNRVEQMMCKHLLKLDHLTIYYLWKSLLSILESTEKRWKALLQEYHPAKHQVHHQMIFRAKSFHAISFMGNPGTSLKVPNCTTWTGALWWLIQWILDLEKTTEILSSWMRWKCKYHAGFWIYPHMLHTYHTGGFGSEIFGPSQVP